MRTRKLMLAVAVLAVASLAAGPLIGATLVSSKLRALDKVATVGCSTDLMVRVDPALVGGTAQLYIATHDGSVVSQGEFDLDATAIVLTTQVPTWATPGSVVHFFYRSYNADGAYFDTSNWAPVLLATGSQGTDEPPDWD